MPRSIVAVLVALAAFTTAGANAADDATLTPVILSSRPGLVTGGSALIAVPTDPQARVRVDGRDVTWRFKPDPADASRSLGVIVGLRKGRNRVTMDHGSRHGTLDLVNWPITGPVISGPHQTPFICQAEEFSMPDGAKLDGVIDAECSIKPVVSYLYLAQGASSLTPLTDFEQRPANVATTTTLSGRTVPFFVRIETRTIDRGIYESAVLHDPFSELDPTPVTPPKGWNRRLIAVEGFGCSGGWYIQGSSLGNIAMGGFDFSLLNLGRLAEGYAMISNTLLHPSNNCNAVLASEAAMMSKEQFVKTHGVPDFTVSAGCSGGSYTSALMADRMPGLFDGVLLACTYPDPLAIALAGSDALLLVRYFSDDDAADLTDPQRIAISGFKNMHAFIDAANQCGRVDPIVRKAYGTAYTAASFSHSVPDSVRYDPVTNPRGARPTVYDVARNVYGVDKRTGFALRPFDNVGVQYGLQALNDKVISPEQFLALNERVGGFDFDANPTAARSTGDAGAIRRAQQGGLQLGANGGLRDIPVFDITGTYNEDGLYHYQWYHFALRARLAYANGNADNEVMWRGNPVPAETAWATFIDWVAATKADRSDRPARQKTIDAKPAIAVDGCWKDERTFVKETLTLGHDDGSVCNTLLPSWSFPRRIAGGPESAHIMKCALKPVEAADYSVAFSDGQMARLRRIFPGGVCDWKQPGSFAGVQPFGSFGPSKDQLLYDVAAH